MVSRRRRPLPPRGRRPARPAMQRIQRAETLYRRGNYEESARIFLELAKGARRRGMLEPAGNMHLRAGRSLLEAGEVEESLQQARAGLTAFREAGRMDRVSQALPRVLQALEAHGYEDEAEQLRREIDALPPMQGGYRHKPSRRQRRGTLPAKCPSCGASLDSNEVEWIDPFTASCAYCGSSVKTEMPGEA